MGRLPLFDNAPVLAFDPTPTFLSEPEKTHFDGECYDPALDQDRLTKQLGRIWALMADERWRSLPAIAAATGDPEASISAQLRHLRKPRFGSYTVERRRVGNLYEYRVLTRK
jgi:hypothetical protein